MLDLGIAPSMPGGVIARRRRARVSAAAAQLENGPAGFGGRASAAALCLGSRVPECQRRVQAAGHERWPAADHFSGKYTSVMASCSGTSG
jgi:hypothetical protein